VFSCLMNKAMINRAMQKRKFQKTFDSKLNKGKLSIDIIGNQKANEQLLEHIREIHRKNRSVYGSPLITDELNEQGVLCGKNRVARIMRGNGIRAQVKRRFSWRYPEKAKWVFTIMIREKLRPIFIKYKPIRKSSLTLFF